ncbi:undecaprenyl-diphosphate phosphatase [Fulvivirga sedimenti]|jgi:undecaprenyl-diphosphatase|uniref:Undecaprenyl-diphosphatase n=1 Tax=Fulvivirga sedimenti TaxID=2879465 RepID=A0A9X1HL47_9BACT|nr:undecaprenyl-diphosphate phosphatase [Fulvivirga sedimenti]MCA6073316.1 undecaprenyl-diphosphate phosphatase [Fulvivirga sedimenti]
MNTLEALILGIVQGLTEFLPVSSSGHIELGTYLLNVQSSDNLIFAILVHGATALSTIVVFRRDILDLLRGLLKFSWNEETQFVAKIVISMIPVGLAGVLYEDEIEQLFGGNVVFVALMLLVTGTLLLITWFTKDRDGSVTWWKALIIGIAQAIAILPGISRSGATITTALYLGVEKNKATRFSFLMVLPPIIGAMLLKFKDIAEAPELATNIPVSVLITGFVAAFVAGLIACQWMISIVRKGKLIYFAYYCYAIAIITLIFYFIS